MESGELSAAVDQVIRRLRQQGLSRADAEDCAHEALLALLIRQTNPDAEPITAVRAWLTLVAHRKLVDRLRRADLERRTLTHPRTAVPTTSDPADVVTDRAMAGWLAKALDELPEDTLLVCRSVAAGISIDDIAARSGLTRRSVQSHLTRARSLLRHLAAGVAAAVAGTLVWMTRHTTAAAAATAPVVLTAATVISVTHLPHHTTLPHHTAPPQANAQTPGVIRTFPPPDSPLAPPPLPQSESTRPTTSSEPTTTSANEHTTPAPSRAPTTDRTSTPQTTDRHDPPTSTSTSTAGSARTPTTTGPTRGSRHRAGATDQAEHHLRPRTAEHVHTPPDHPIGPPTRPDTHHIGTADSQPPTIHDADPVRSPTRPVIPTRTTTPQSWRRTPRPGYNQ
ncbi:RNA polymerase sigma factor (sigma-70 family) [Saccharothrix carnea]|uniref:RNA polymerase sigma factor (Sigma-70 family) n=2 Tax=Saccharothrix carnea TaxID=1280637 RepID=A0A2P8I215_SACCR|nr:RNA polymerase sigma factor (sigma-70 family) [Saccharothrix carnea]